MFVLILNDMRSAKIEYVHAVCVAETLEELQDFVNENAVESYRTDNRWQKVFREGGPLEWFNEPHSLELIRRSESFDGYWGWPGIYLAEEVNIHPAQFPNVSALR